MNMATHIRNKQLINESVNIGNMSYLSNPPDNIAHLSLILIEEWGLSHFPHSPSTLISPTVISSTLISPTLILSTQDQFVSFRLLTIKLHNKHYEETWLMENIRTNNHVKCLSSAIIWSLRMTLLQCR